MQRDPAGYIDGMNLYQYSVSNPIRGLDPQGLACCDDKTYSGFAEDTFTHSTSGQGTKSEERFTKGGSAEKANEKTDGKTDQGIPPPPDHTHSESKIPLQSANPQKPSLSGGNLDRYTEGHIETAPGPMTPAATPGIRATSAAILVGIALEMLDQWHEAEKYDVVKMAEEKAKARAEKECETFCASHKCEGSGECKGAATGHFWEPPPSKPGDPPAFQRPSYTEYRDKSAKGNMGWVQEGWARYEYTCKCACGKK
jgi:hypothetical protein